MLLSGRTYVDDIWRTLRGYSNWIAAGRPLADWLMQTLNFGLPLTDLAPLPQLGGIGAVALGAFLLYRAIDRGDLPFALPALAASLLLLNPFLLECMSYKFDALPMGLSVLLAVVAALPSSRKFWPATLVGAASIFALLNLYQVSLSLVPSLALIIAMAAGSRGDAAGRIALHIGRVALSMMIALLAYWPLSRLMPIGAYGEKLTQGLSIDRHLPMAVLRNILRTMGWVLDGFSPLQLAILGGLTLIAWLYALVLATRLLRSNGPLAARLLLALLHALSPILLAICWFGLSNAYQIAWLVPRMFIGVGATAVYIALFAGMAVADTLRLIRRLPTRAWQIPALLATLVPVALGLVTAYAMGNAEAAQRRFDERVVTQLIAALDDAGIRPGVTLVVDGTIPFAPDAAPQIAKFPLLGTDMVPRYLRAGWVWGARLVTLNGFSVKHPNDEAAAQTLASAAGVEPFFTNHIFSLTRIDKSVVMSFTR